ncbi:MAG: hypothetical protein ACXQS8_05475 [Candidatus Helarchaeales archaeon]
MSHFNIYDILLSLHNAGATSKSRAISLDQVSYKLNLKKEQLKQSIEELEENGLLVTSFKKDSDVPHLFLTRKGILSVCSSFT